jgi:hypothetical protein
MCHISSDWSFLSYRTEREVNIVKRRRDHKMLPTFRKILDVKEKPKMKNSIFSDITSCTPFEVNRHFGRTCGLHLQGRRISQGRNQREESSLGWSRWFMEHIFGSCMGRSRNVCTELWAGSHEAPSPCWPYASLGDVTFNTEATNWPVLPTVSIQQSGRDKTPETTPWAGIRLNWLPNFLFRYWYTSLSNVSQKANVILEK